MSYLRLTSTPNTGTTILSPSAKAEKRRQDKEGGTHILMSAEEILAEKAQRRAAWRQARLKSLEQVNILLDINSVFFYIDLVIHPAI